MVKQYEDETYIYESPDGGKSVYRREVGGITRELMTSDSPNDLFRYAEFVKIIDMSYSNPALKKALDNLLLIYYTVKDGTE